MPVVMFMEWEGVTRQQYEAVCEVVDFERKHPPGGMFHVAAADERGLRVTDVWESAEAFQKFVNDRLMPGVQKVGIKSEPKVTILQALKVFTPGYTPK